MSTLYVDQILPKDGDTITVNAKLIPTQRLAFRKTGTFTDAGIITNWTETSKAPFDYTDGAFNSTTGVFTVPVGGVWFLSVKYTPTVNDNFRALVKLYINGLAFDEIIDQEPADYYMSHDLNHAAVYQFNAGDTLSISSENAPAASSFAVWTMYLLG